MGTGQTVPMGNSRLPLPCPPRATQGAEAGENQCCLEPGGHRGSLAPCMRCTCRARAGGGDQPKCTAGLWPSTQGPAVLTRPSSWFSCSRSMGQRGKAEMGGAAVGTSTSPSTRMHLPEAAAVGPAHSWHRLLPDLEAGAAPPAPTPGARISCCLVLTQPTTPLPHLNGILELLVRLCLLCLLHAARRQVLGNRWRHQGQPCPSPQDTEQMGPMRSQGGECLDRLPGSGP